MKSLLRYLAFVLMVGGACAQSNFPPCVGRDISRWDGCFGVFNVQGDLNAKPEYIGTFKNGKRHGYGKIFWISGYSWEGNFFEGEEDGIGKVVNLDGASYSLRFTRGGVSPQQDANNLNCFFKYPECVLESANNVKNKYSIEARQLGEENRNRFPNEPLQTFNNATKKQAEPESQLNIAPQPVTEQSTPTKISQRDSKRIALVIGNANYASAPLKNPINDAADISTALRQSGFEVIDQRNATLQEMTRGIREFGDKCNDPLNSCSGHNNGRIMK